MQGATGGRCKTAAGLQPAAGDGLAQGLAQVAGQSLQRRRRPQGGIRGDQPWTRSLKSLPAVKAGTFLAGILIFSPVLGFRP